MSAKRQLKSPSEQKHPILKPKRNRNNSHKSGRRGSNPCSPFPLSSSRLFQKYGLAMMLPRLSLQSISYLLPLLFVTILGPRQVLGGDILETKGFATCQASNSINISRLQIQYDRSTNNITFDLAGSSDKVQNVTALLTVTAYGRRLDEQSVDPCEKGIMDLCPGMTIVL